jgi:AcrR family transcriptional regulator
MTGSADEMIPRILPRGRHTLDDSVVSASQRLRLIDAMTELCAEQTYPATSVADVIARSGISRKTFYEHFTNKEECFIAAYERGVEDLQREIAAAVLGAPTWRARLRAVCFTYTESLASNPAFARLFVLEAVAAGPEIRRRRDLAFDRFVELYRGLHHQAKQEWPAIPDLEPESLAAVIGAVAELSRIAVSQRGPEGLRDITETLVSISWTLLKGLEPLPDDPSDR